MSEVFHAEDAALKGHTLAALKQVCWYAKAPGCPGALSCFNSVVYRSLRYSAMASSTGRNPLVESASLNEQAAAAVPSSIASLSA